MVRDTLLLRRGAHETVQKIISADDAPPTERSRQFATINREQSTMAQASGVGSRASVKLGRMRPRVFAVPEGPALELSLAPRLESWDRRDHPSQVALRRFVAHVHELVDPIIDRTPGELVLRLDVGLEDTVDPLWERDLDNYLFPIVRTLPERVVSVWGTKGRDARSCVRLERAVEVSSHPGWQAFEVPRTRGTDRSVKAAVRRAVTGGDELPPGPVGVELALVTGPERSWPMTWKASIDGLEPLLGKTYEDRIWNPQDGRIVRLGLHQTTDYSLGHDVTMTLWARPADPNWPELRWLTELHPDARQVFLRARPPKKPRARTPADPQPQAPRSGPTAPHGPVVIPAGESTASVELFRDNDDGYLSWLASHAGGFVVNIQRSGNPSDARLHLATCRTVSGVNPRRGPWTGAYVKACSTDLISLDAWAIREVGSPVARCGICRPQPARPA